MQIELTLHLGYRNGWSRWHIIDLSTRLTQSSALEPSVKDQMQWSEDLEATVDEIHRSLFGCGTRSGTKRDKPTRS